MSDYAEMAANAIKFDEMTIRIRASSWGELADCPARWYAKNIEGMRMPSSPAATLGSAIHASTAAYDQARVDQSPISVSDAAGALVDYLREAGPETDWAEGDFTTRECESIGLALHTRYCREIAPKREYVAVETDTGELTVNVPDVRVNILMTGHIDRVRRAADGRLGVSDLKSGKTVVAPDGSVKTAGHSYQLASYKLLYQAHSGQVLDAPAEIIGLTTGKTAAGQRVGVGQCEDVEATLLGSDEQPGMIQAAATMARAGIFWGNPKSMLCSAKFCPAYARCQFRR